jgi:hypothetical protein
MVGAAAAAVARHRLMQALKSPWPYLFVVDLLLSECYRFDSCWRMIH